MIVGFVKFLHTKVLVICCGLELFQILESLPIVLHECFEHFADSFDLGAHSLTHPDGSFHVFLLVLYFTART